MSANVTARHQAAADAVYATHLRAASYGAQQTNPLSAEHIAAREAIDYSKPRTRLGNRELVKVTRLRLVSDPGFPLWDVSYCYGELADGTPVEVDLGACQLSKRNLKGQLLKLAKEAGRYAKGLGLLDDGVISKLQ